MRARADRVESLPNLGPKSAHMLRTAGIQTPAQLKKYGAVKAYTKVRAIHKRAPLNLLWALEAALSGRTWQDVARNDRLRLLLAVEDCLGPTVSNTGSKVARRRKSRPIRQRVSAR